MIKIFVITDSHFLIGNSHQHHIDMLNGFVHLANKEKPDLILHLGDIVHAEVAETYRQFRDKFSFFMKIWDKLDSQLLRAVLPGNHDYDQLCSEELLSLLNYSHRLPVKGSKFNRSFNFKITGVSLRVLAVDAQLRKDGSYPQYMRGEQRSRTENKENLIDIKPKWESYKPWDYDLLYEGVELPGYGRMWDGCLEWIRDELLNSKEELAMIFSHQGPPAFLPNHLDIDHFISDHAYSLLGIVTESIYKQTPLDEVYSIFGHGHPPSGEIEIFNNLGDNLPGFMLPHVSGNRSEAGHKFTEITVDSKGVNLTVRSMLNGNKLSCIPNLREVDI